MVQVLPNQLLLVLELFYYSTTNDMYFLFNNMHGSSGMTNQFNFGNGYFGTTAVSSAGTNASNLGIFEYDVPSGYTALSTKGLNEYMAYTTINKSTDYFNTVLYTGNGGTQCH